MTRKDYELLANSFRRSIRVLGLSEKNKVRAEGNRRAISLLAHDIAGSIYGENKAFDRDRFIKECGVTPVGAK